MYLNRKMGKGYDLTFLKRNIQVTNHSPPHSHTPDNLLSNIY